LGFYNPNYELLQPLHPMSGYKICIDAGHGGQDPMLSCYTGGTWGINTRQSESDVNLNVGMALKTYCEGMGATVIMTRTNECRLTPICVKSAELGVRAQIANMNDCDLFVSIHHNDSKKPDVNYSLTFYNSGSLVKSKSLACWIGAFLHVDDGLPSLGVSRGNFAVLNKLNMPGVLVEASFMSNPCQDYKLASYCVDSCGRYRYPYIEREAWSIAKGLSLYCLCQKAQFNMTPLFIKKDKFGVKSGKRKRR
jgi:N-acetylmuramoyl-L-alanine amidase